MDHLKAVGKAIKNSPRTLRKKFHLDHHQRELEIILHSSFLVHATSVRGVRQPRVATAAYSFVGNQYIHVHRRVGIHRYTCAELGPGDIFMYCVHQLYSALSSRQWIM